MGDGARSHSYAMPPAHRRALVVITAMGWLMAVAGVAMLFRGEPEGQARLARAGSQFVVEGALLGAFGLYLLGYSFRRWTIDEDGLRLTALYGNATIRWDEVVDYRLSAGPSYRIRGPRQQVGLSTRLTADAVQATRDLEAWLAPVRQRLFERWASTGAVFRPQARVMPHAVMATLLLAIAVPLGLARPTVGLTPAAAGAVLALVVWPIALQRLRLDGLTLSLRGKSVFLPAVDRVVISRVSDLNGSERVTLHQGEQTLTLVDTCPNYLLLLRYLLERVPASAVVDDEGLPADSATAVAFEGLRGLAAPVDESARKREIDRRSRRRGVPLFLLVAGWLGGPLLLGCHFLQSSQGRRYLEQGTRTTARVIVVPGGGTGWYEFAVAGQRHRSLMYPDELAMARTKPTVEVAYLPEQPERSKLVLRAEREARGFPVGAAIGLVLVLLGLVGLRWQFGLDAEDRRRREASQPGA